MNLKHAEEFISEVTALPETKCLYSSYIGFLSSERNPDSLDEEMLNYLRGITADSVLLEEVNDYLSGIDYTRMGYIVEPVIEQLERFRQLNHPDGRWRKGHKTAKEDMMKEFSDFNLKSLVYGGNANIRDFVPRKDAHAGSIFLKTGRRTKGEYLDELPTLYAEAEDRARIDGSFNAPIMTLIRTGASLPYDTEGNETFEFEVKPRVVSAVHLMLIMAETRFANPVQRKFSILDWYAGGKNNHGIWLNILQMMNHFKNGSWISLDYSKFDQSISDWLIYDAFDIIRQAFINDRHFDEEIFKIIREDFIHKVFIGPEGKLYESHKGVPSGSMFTQIIDSVVNRLMIKAIFNSLGWEEGKDYMMIIMGDDNLIYIKEPDPEPHLDNISRMLAKCYGITSNVTKIKRGHRSIPPHFLSRDWTPFGVNRDLRELLLRLLYPESYRDYKKKGFTPSQVVQSYVEEYEIPMRKLILLSEHRQHVANDRRKMGAEAWQTGLEQYRARVAADRGDISNLIYNHSW